MQNEPRTIYLLNVHATIVYIILYSTYYRTKFSKYLYMFRAAKMPFNARSRYFLPNHGP